MKRKIAAATITVLLLTTALCEVLPFCAAHAEDSIEKQLQQQEQQYDELRKKIVGTRQKIVESRKKEKNVVRQIDVINKKIDDTQKKVDIVVKDIKLVEGNINVLNSQISAIKKRIAECENYLRKRFVSMYKYGRFSEYSALLSSEGVQTAMDNMYLLGKIAKQDQYIILELSEQKQRLGDKQTALGRQKGILKEKNNELNVQHAQLKTAVGEKQIALQQIQKEKEAYIAQQREFEKAARELQGTINKLLAAKRAKNKSSKKTSVVYYKGGKIAWPVQGSITSSYGIRVHPVFKTKTKHSGIDIAASTGTPIGAASAGEVLYAGSMRGYGNVVIIDHGNNLTTVYGHMSKMSCSENQKVAKGSIIGYVGMTGITTGPHLHFEVRVNGNTVDPMSYLR